MITLHLHYHKWVAFLLIVSSDHFNPFPIMFATVKTGIWLSQESWTPAEAILVWFLARAGYNLGKLTADLQGVRRRNYNGETAYMWRAWRISVSWSSLKVLEHKQQGKMLWKSAIWIAPWAKVGQRKCQRNREGPIVNHIGLILKLLAQSHFFSNISETCRIHSDNVLAFQEFPVP